MKSETEIRKVLSKKKFYVWRKLEKLTPKIGNNIEYMVIYIDKNKVKFGKLSDPYYHRYGVEVMATYLIKNERFWYQSEKVCVTMNKIVETLMMKLAQGEEIYLPILDIDELEVRD